MHPVAIRRDARIDIPSTRVSRRIAVNSSTGDNSTLSPSSRLVNHDKATVHPRRMGQIKAPQPPHGVSQPGPTQTARIDKSGAKANSECRSHAAGG